MNTTQYAQPIADDFHACLSDWISDLYTCKIRRVCFRRLKSENGERYNSGFLSLYAYSVFTGAANRGRDIADLQTLFGVSMSTRVWLSQILFWHHVLIGKCGYLSFDVNRPDLVSSLCFQNIRANDVTTNAHGQPISSDEAAKWILARI